MKTLDYATIYNVLMDLLEIKDGDMLPNCSGVCLEVGKATRRCVGATPITPEYAWVSDHAKNFCKLAYVDDMGFMTPKRREFIHYLLKMLENQQGARND